MMFATFRQRGFQQFSLFVATIMHILDRSIPAPCPCGHCLPRHAEQAPAACAVCATQANDQRFRLRRRGSGPYDDPDIDRIKALAPAMAHQPHAKPPAPHLALDPVGQQATAIIREPVNDGRAYMLDLGR